MDDEISVLLVEDNEIDRMAFERSIKQENLPYDYFFATSVAEARQVLAEREFDVVLLDYILGDGTALDLVGRTGSAPSVVITGTGEVEIAVQAMKAGAREYLIKDPEGNYLKMLPTAIESAIRHQREEQELAQYREHLEQVVEKRTSQLRENEERFRSLVEKARDAVAIVDAGGMVRYVSPSVIQILGFTEEEMVGHPFIDWVHPDEQGNNLEVLARLIESEPFVVIETRTRHKDGSWLIVEASIRNELANPAVKGIVINFQDITERKQATADKEKMQAQLLQSQKMEAIGHLTAGIAHDFNNLLTAINGFAELMRLQLSPNDPLSEYVGKILASGQRAANLVRQLLIFSRKDVVEPRVININAIVTDLQNMLHRIIGENIVLETTLASDLGSVKADPTEIEQVVVNMVVNARDAMPDGGQLIIETLNVTLDQTTLPSLKGSAGYVLLAITDSGVGMNKDVQEHIFEPFFTTKGPGMGTGLGLSTVYAIVEKSHGTVHVYSEEGLGSTFKIYLPRVDDTGTPTASRHDTQAVPQGNEIILLAEDDTGVREMAHLALADFGYTVLEARDGKEALMIASHHDKIIHLLLTDVVMPDMNGRELADHLIRLRPEVKVLYMSGYMGSTISRHKINEPDIAFLQKPFTPSTLVRKVRKVLDES